MRLVAALAYEFQKERPLFPNLVAIDSPAASSKDRKKNRPARDHNDRKEPQDRPKRKRDKSATDGIPMVTYRIEIGRNDDVSPKNIVGAIANEADIDAQYIGHIKLHDEYSTVDLPEGMPKELFNHLYKVRVCQKPLKISSQRFCRRSTRGKAKKAKRKTCCSQKPAFKGRDSEPRKPRKRPAKTNS